LEQPLDHQPTFGDEKFPAASDVFRLQVAIGIEPRIGDVGDFDQIHAAMAREKVAG
jgi:hypothetical protein